MSPLFDDSVFSELRDEVGEDCIQDILDGFWADTHRAIQRLAESRQTRAVVKLEAHSIKSSAQLLGFARLSRLAGVLEAGADSLDDAELGAGIVEFQRVFDQTRTAAPPAR